jgi:hypothetical protein
MCLEPVTDRVAPRNLIFKISPRQLFFISHVN